MEIDKDLAARQEARLLCRQAEAAQKILEKFPQEKLDAIVENIAKARFPHRHLCKLRSGCGKHLGYRLHDGV